MATDAESVRIRQLSNRYATVTLQEGELFLLAEALDTYGREVYSYEYDPTNLDALRDRIDRLRDGLPKLPPVKDA